MSRPRALFAQLLGTAFDTLPAPVRALHERPLPHTFTGRGRVIRGKNPLSRVCAAMARLPPPSADMAVSVTISGDEQVQTWERSFGGHPMSSRMWARNGELHENLGAMRFRFCLQVRDAGIEWHIVGARALGVPLPPAWFEQVRARESADGERYRFDVHAALPLVGLLVRYEGFLEP